MGRGSRVRLHRRGLAQAAIQLQDFGDVLVDLVAGAATVDDEVFRGRVAVGTGRGLDGIRLRVMLPESEYRGISKDVDYSRCRYNDRGS